MFETTNTTKPMAIKSVEKLRVVFLVHVIADLSESCVVAELVPAVVVILQSTLRAEHL